MSTLPAATDYTGSSVTQGGKKAFMTSLRAWIAAALGTDDTSITIPTLTVTTAMTANGAVTLGNSSGDVFTANSDKVVSSLAGGLNFPLQSSFFATLAASAANNVTGDGTLYDVICDTEVYDQNSDYNNASGLFTAPVTGRYLFSGGAMLQQLGSAHTTGYLSLTASNRFALVFQGNVGAMRDPTDAMVMSGAAMIDMDAGDTCKMQVYVANGTKVVDLSNNGTHALTFFSGHLMA